MHRIQARLEVRAYRRAALPAERIVTLTGVSPRTQRRIAHEEVTFDMTDKQLHQQAGVGRPTVLSSPLQQQIQACLGEDPRMKGAEILRRLRTEHGYQASKGPVYDYLKTARPPKPPGPPLVRFEGVAGEFAQHDFGTLTVRYTDGTREALTFYAGRLKFSRALYVCLVDGEDTEALLRGMEAFGRAMGGLPQRNVVDNTKAAVIKRVKDPASGSERILLNEQLATFLSEVGVFAEPTAPYSGNQKGSVENLIGFVKAGFLLARRFRHRADLARQLGEWLHYVNAQRPCDATGVIPAVRLAEERPYLRPLPFGEGGFGLLYSGVVGRDAFVRWGGSGYSTPAGWIGQSVSVRVHREQVVLHYHGEQVVHPRCPENGRYSLLPEHRAALFVKPRGEIMAKRQILMDLSPEAQQFFTQLVHRRPQSWRSVDLPVLWALFEQHGPTRIQAAFAYCVGQQAIGGEYLQAWLMGMAP